MEIALSFWFRWHPMLNSDITPISLHQYTRKQKHTQTQPIRLTLAWTCRYTNQYKTPAATRHNQIHQNSWYQLETWTNNRGTFQFPLPTSLTPALPLPHLDSLGPLPSCLKASSVHSPLHISTERVRLKASSVNTRWTHRQKTDDSPHRHPLERRRFLPFTHSLHSGRLHVFTVFIVTPATCKMEN